MLEIRGNRGRVGMIVLFFTNLSLLDSLHEKRFVATGQIFLGVVGDRAAPTVVCLGSTRPAAPTNRTAEAAGDTSRPYKWVGFVAAAHSPAAPRYCYL